MLRNTDSKDIIALLGLETEPTETPTTSAETGWEGDGGTTGGGTEEEPDMIKSSQRLTKIKST